MCEKKIAFIYLGKEHDEYGALLDALRARGVDGELVLLDHAPDIDWAPYDLVSLRMCRGIHLDRQFYDKVAALKRQLDAVAGKCIPLVNPLRMVEAGMDKHCYLRALENAGANIIPTRWVDVGNAGSLESIMQEEGWDEVVLKPTVSTLCWRSYHIARKNGVFTVTEPKTVRAKPATEKEDARYEEFLTRSSLPMHERVFRGLVAEGTVCVQQFMPKILSEGEISCVFMGGRFSHAIQKRVKPGGGWVAHEVYGGTNMMKAVSEREQAWAEAIYAKITHLYGELLYGRVDGIPDDAGDLRLLECELVVPRLFLREANAVDRYADTLVQVLGGA